MSAKKWLVGLSVLAAVLLFSISSSQAAKIYYGTVSGGDIVAEFGQIVGNNLTGGNVIAEPDGTFPADNPVEPIDDAAGRVRAIAYNTTDGGMYGIIRGWVRGGDPDFVKIDVNTGQVTELVKGNIGPVSSGLTYNPATNDFFAVTNVHDNNSLIRTMALDGELAPLPNPVGWAVFDAALDPATGTMYSVGVVGGPGGGTHDLITIDTTTGEGSLVKADIGVSEYVQGMTVHNGALLVTANASASPQTITGPYPHGGNELWSISFDGETVTQLNADLGAHVSGIESVIPEPTSVLLLVLGAFGLLGIRRR